MTDITRSQLEQAYRLIQQEDLDKAIAILKPITGAQPDNVDAWWLLANAVSEPEDANQALSNVLRLEPNHAQARTLLDQLRAQFPELGSSPAPASSGYGDLFGSEPVAAPSSSSGFEETDIDSLFGDTSTSSFGSSDFDATTTPEMTDQDLGAFFTPQAENEPFANDPFASSEPAFVQAGTFEEEAPEEPRKKRGKKPKEDKPKKRTDKDFVKEEDQKLAADDPMAIEARINRRPSPAMLIAVMLLLIIVVAAGVTVAIMTGVINLNPTAQPTQVAAVGTGTAVSSTSAAGGTSLSSTPGGAATSAADTALSGALHDVLTLFQGNDFSSAKADMVVSSLGNTLQVQICDVAGPDLQAHVTKAMDLVAQQAAQARSSVQAAGIQVVSCSKPDVTLYRAVAGINDITAYVDSGMTDTRTFQASWKRS